MHSVWLFQSQTIRTKSINCNSSHSCKRHHVHLLDVRPIVAFQLENVLITRRIVSDTFLPSSKRRLHRSSRECGTKTRSATPQHWIMSLHQLLIKSGKWKTFKPFFMVSFYLRTVRLRKYRHITRRIIIGSLCIVTLVVTVLSLMFHALQA